LKKKILDSKSWRDKTDSGVYMFSSPNRIGFSTAMASNLTNQSRNVLSKKLMANEEVTTLLTETLTMYSVKKL
jgi:hypothetical protein